MTQDRSAAGDRSGAHAASPDETPSAPGRGVQGPQGSRRTGAPAAEDPPTDVLARVTGRRPASSTSAGRGTGAGAAPSGAPTAAAAAAGTSGSSALTAAQSVPTGTAAGTGTSGPIGSRLGGAAGPRTPGQRRRARLGLVRVDPWSVFVLSLLISVFLGIVLVVAVVVLYSLLSTLGVLDSLDTFARDLQIIKEGQSLIGFTRVFGIAAVIAALDVVLLTVLATLAAFLYNLCASFTGGVEVVLAERD